MTDTPNDKATPHDAATLRVRRVAIDTYRENVAYLHRDCPVYRAEGFQALSKVEVGGNGSTIVATLNVVDDTCIIEPSDLGLSEQAFDQLGMTEGALVHIGHAEHARSMDRVRAKMAGERLSLDDFRAITQDIASSRYSKVEMAAFLVSSGQSGLDRDEVYYLTRAMTETGERISWNESLVADKHCIGGLPGNRTSMLVVPIVAAHGMLIPKTSSRAITSPAGTADTMEILANVDLPLERLRDIVQRERGCLAWGGTAKLAPVDDILISVERPLGIDHQGQLVASILAKKVAAGSTHLLIDIPVGPTAKVRHMREALQLRKLFEYVGDRLGLHLEVIITDGRQPVGRGIGPALEARDVMQVLQNAPEAPSDLRQKALRLAGRVIEFDPDVRGGAGFAIARDILDSGRALAKMQTIIDAQGRVETAYDPGPLSYEVKAEAAGYVRSIDNFLLARLARLAGAPMDKGAGVDLVKKYGDQVQANDVLYRVHAEHTSDFEFARRFNAQRGSGYILGAERPHPRAFDDS